ncbi:CDP-alcohol phosphatidyltransferase family protein [Alkalisalibacterium limincola]|uniref:CDP-alcohol phosphatidyltransferase family protein n=1 Tax=Alkalisalibacterium limincola TaxID=2699169 RepID=A0A5C8KKY1_9GAMM|nr:CDP-alcohol phosphatidyltransferase family protein [Alkalisalibacterium limincola]TXK60733.1 CDP-alcohol phosphatidyltransferase family protein [Alkalisalibacterium limincola]
MSTTRQRAAVKLRHVPGPAPVADLAWGALALAAAGWALAAALPLDVPALAAGAAAYVLVAVLVAARAPSGEGRGARLGAANRVTLVRATLGCVLAMLALGAATSAAAQWTMIAVATLALSLDGVDGALARRLGQQSRFGARFDMETDAAVLLVLSLAVVLSGKLGPWVLAIGAMRYAFVAAGRVWPALRADLPPSLARRVVCVVQGIALCVALGPIVPSWLAAIAVAIALLLLLASFARDTAWLLRHSAGSTRRTRPSDASVRR